LRTRAGQACLQELDTIADRRAHWLQLIGRNPRSLIASVRQEILETMRNWREHWLANPSNLNSRFLQPFAGLSCCRMPHELRRVASNRAGGARARKWTVAGGN
jgi:hypothetical protein